MRQRILPRPRTCPRTPGTRPSGSSSRHGSLDSGPRSRRARVRAGASTSRKGRSTRPRRRRRTPSPPYTRPGLVRVAAQESEPPSTSRCIRTAARSHRPRAHPPRTPRGGARRARCGSYARASVPRRERTTRVRLTAARSRGRPHRRALARAGPWRWPRSSSRDGRAGGRSSPFRRGPRSPPR
jgi:hypothetical protein